MNTSEKVQELTCQADVFSLPTRVHYLNCAYAAPLMRPVEAAAAWALFRLRSPHQLGAAAFFDEAERARELFARLVNGDAEGVALLPSVSYGVALAARNVRVERGQNVVIAEGQFPSNVYGWRRLCGERGATLRVVPGNRIVEAIDRRTAVVGIGTVDWTDGTVYPLQEIGERARDVGAALVLDGIQSVGAMPFDVRAVQPDFLVCASYKWLLGPMGLGVCWMSPKFRDGVPLEETWLGRCNSFDFARLTQYVDEYEPGARRFDAGGRAQFVLLPMLNAALTQLLEWEVDRIQRYSRRVGCIARRELEELGCEVSDGAGHLFAIRPPSGIEATELHRELERAGVYVSLRGERLRVSVNVFNDEKDLGALLDVAGQLCRGSAAVTRLV